MALPYMFSFWAMPHQWPPEGEWRTWVILGGRGAGKTRAGSEWVRAQVEGSRPRDPGTCRRVALVGETFDQVREVMVFGESGILACSPPDRRPVWQATRRCLVWPNGAEAMAFTAQEPEALRGPQFDCAWADELAKWKKAQETWDMLQFALRLGAAPRVCVTTTPRTTGLMKRLIEQGSTVLTHGATSVNAANLAASYMTEVTERYGGTTLGRQELDGLFIEDIDGALWTHAMLDAARIEEVPECSRIVVAVDPPATSGAKSDLCGIVVAGRIAGSERLAVLQDASLKQASPNQWCEAVLRVRENWGASRIVVETNQGGDMVAGMLRSIDPYAPVSGVRASQSKGARAEPVALLYERGQVAHVAGLDELEAQMCLMTACGYEGQGSPDRLDALVWALHALTSGGRGSGPSLRAVG
ncbi:DNA-packaging protein [Litorisediminicola beolgyonensis]|uniref:DNA-packaging protein n=1 Tax=Litorisediminicola beolgyonensis TaxID=1173614 RepID=A0ABW3ZNH8_9RHOB